jgi:Ca2+-binding EF-hand superfamily protein
VLCKQQRIRVGEFFRDFDKLRTGFITKSQFRIGLNMAKVQISSQEFELLSKEFKAPKEGEHVCWKDFVDRVDEVFTKKGLEKDHTISLDDVRTTTIYAKTEPTAHDREVVQQCVEAFKAVIRQHRLDAKSFFQDFDKHCHFKVSQKIFRQVLVHLGLTLSTDEVAKIALVYGAENNEIKYADFLKDCNCLEYIINEPTTGMKSTYKENNTDFTGVKEHNKLLYKIQCMIKKDRIRLLEYFQDHDLLRKGYLPHQKFRSVLHSQKVELTTEEYGRLEKYYAMPTDSTLVNYKTFCSEVDSIFTAPDIEKDPLKRVQTFTAPSILDPKDYLSRDEDQALDQLMQRLGTHVANHRLLMKPFFQDKDKSRSGFVNFTRFRSIFDNFKLKLTDEEFALIAKRFHAKAANEINYVEFDYVLRKYSGDDKPF